MLRVFTLFLLLLGISSCNAEDEIPSIPNGTGALYKCESSLKNSDGNNILIYYYISNASLYKNVENDTVEEIIHIIDINGKEWNITKDESQYYTCKEKQSGN